MRKLASGIVACAVSVVALSGCSAHDEVVEVTEVAPTKTVTVTKTLPKKPTVGKSHGRTSGGVKKPVRPVEPVVPVEPPAVAPDDVPAPAPKPAPKPEPKPAPEPAPSPSTQEAPRGDVLPKPHDPRPTTPVIPHFGV